MKKTSTPKATDTLQQKRPELQPSTKTLEFLRQFARAYSFEPQLPLALGGFVNN